MGWDQISKKNLVFISLALIFCPILSLLSFWDSSDMCLKSAWYYSIDISYSILKNIFFFYASVWMTFIELCSRSPMIFSVMVKLLLELANEFVSNIRFFSSSIFIWFFSFSNFLKILHQFSSVPQLCPTLCDPMNRSTPGFPVHHQLTEFTQTHVHQVGDSI